MAVADNNASSFHDRYVYTGVCPYLLNRLPEKQKMYMARQVFIHLVIVTVASCTWSPVFERKAHLTPAVAIDDETSTALTQVCSTL